MPQWSKSRTLAGVHASALPQHREAWPGFRRSGNRLVLQFTPIPRLKVAPGLRTGCFCAGIQRFCQTHLSRAATTPGHLQARAFRPEASPGIRSTPAKMSDSPEECGQPEEPDGGTPGCQQRGCGTYDSTRWCGAARETQTVEAGGPTPCGDTVRISPWDKVLLLPRSPNRRLKRLGMKGATAR